MSVADPLARPLALPSGLVLPNRIAKAAMTENLADDRNQPTARYARLYRRWAEGGAGLLLTGNLMVDRRYLERSRNVVADAHLDIPALAHVAEAVGDVPLIAQLGHPGRQCARWIAPTPVAPSAGDAVRLLGAFGRPRALAPAEVEDVVRAFGEAAGRCEAAGLDGVQVHAAHGYLLAQFLSPHTNRRDDRWGGDVEGRAAALLAAVRACRDATGTGFTVAVKLNASDFRHGGFTQDDAEAVVALLAAEGVDLLEISGGTYESPALLGLGVDGGDRDADGAPEAEGTSAFEEAYFAGFARRARRAAPDLPIMLTGGLRTAAAMRALLDSGAVDVVGLGRPLVLDPDLPHRLLDGGAGIDLPPYRQIPLIGLAGESEWYEHQIARLAGGDAPDRDLNPLLAAVRFIGGEVARGVGEGPARRRLARTA